MGRGGGGGGREGDAEYPQAPGHNLGRVGPPRGGTNYTIMDAKGEQSLPQPQG